MIAIKQNTQFKTSVHIIANPAPGIPPPISILSINNSHQNICNAAVPN